MDFTTFAYLSRQQEHGQEEKHGGGEVQQTIRRAVVN